MTEMKLGNTDSPYYYLSRKRVIEDLFKNLLVSTDLVPQYFFWHGINPRMQEIFIQDTNKNKLSLLCTGRGDKVISHATHQCAIYPTASGKSERLNSLNGCGKCGNVSHSSGIVFRGLRFGLLGQIH